LWVPYDELDRPPLKVPVGSEQVVLYRDPPDGVSDHHNRFAYTCGVIAATNENLRRVEGALTAEANLPR
jgi:hypothetical protein